MFNLRKERHGDGESRASARLACTGDSSTEFPGDIVVNYVHAKAGPSTASFCRKERFVYSGNLISGHPIAIISVVNNNPIGFTSDVYGNCSNQQTIKAMIQGIHH